VGIVVKALSLDRDAAELLEGLASSYKNQGQYVSALIWAEAARWEERARLRKMLEDTEAGSWAEE